MSILGGFTFLSPSSTVLRDLITIHRLPVPGTTRYFSIQTVRRTKPTYRIFDGYPPSGVTPFTHSVPPQVRCPLLSCATPLRP